MIKQFKIYFTYTSAEGEDIENDIYQYLKNLHVENLIISNDEENPELFI